MGRLTHCRYTVRFQFLPSNFKPCPPVQPLLNPVQTKREYFWLFLIVIIENAIALVVEVRSSIIFSFTVWASSAFQVYNGGVMTRDGHYYSWDVR